ncbi:MAG: arylsulfatase A-like enzyme [Cyclobacteriaceae bacterium]|jgi:arylsulfatase
MIFKNVLSTDMIKILFSVKHIGLYFLVTIFSLFQSCQPSKKQEVEKEKPNILLIVADDLGYSDLGSYGGEIHTPALDQLAYNGLRFTQFTNSSRCCPSRASLMTGLYPHQAGIGSFTTKKPSPERGPAFLGRLNENCVTLAEVLKEVGYNTYMVGKWHLHDKTGPTLRGFDEFFGFVTGHSHNQWKMSEYYRLPEDRTPEMIYDQDKFYATESFNDYSIEFLKQANKKDKPWFMYLAHSSPHFPIQAPRESIDKYVEVYQKGWDKLREERFARMKDMGMANNTWQLTERSIVPVEKKESITNYYGGKQNPAWDEVDEDRKQDLIYRMATYAAMVDHIDQGITSIINLLKQTGQFENTLILFTSDNGACYEWGPWGFDMPDDGNRGTRLGINTLHKGEDLKKIGGRETFQSYGSAWTNLSNTPFQMYKHFTHEGGLCSPFIAHWPNKIDKPGRFVRAPMHLMDIMPTICEVSGATYPKVFEGKSITPTTGISFLSELSNEGEIKKDRSIYYDHQGAYGMRKGKWKIVRSKRMPTEIEWELYNINEDRSETENLAAKYPDLVNEMEQQWIEWAIEVKVHPVYKTMVIE